MGIDIKHGVKIDNTKPMSAGLAARTVKTNAVKAKEEVIKRGAELIIADSDAKDVASFTNEPHGAKVSAANFALGAAEIAAAAGRGVVVAPINAIGSGLAATGRGIKAGYNWVAGHSVLPGLPVSDKQAMKEAQAEASFEGLLHAIGATYPVHFRDLRALEPQIKSMLVDNDDLHEIAQNKVAQITGKLVSRAAHTATSLPSNAMFFGMLISLAQLSKKAEADAGEVDPEAVPAPLRAQNTQLTRDIQAESTQAFPLTRSTVLASKKQHHHFLPNQMVDADEDAFNGEVVDNAVEKLRMDGSYPVRMARRCGATALMNSAAKACGEELSADQLTKFLISGKMPPSEYQAHVALMGPGESTAKFTRTTGMFLKDKHVDSVGLPFELTSEGTFAQSLLGLVFAGQDLTPEQKEAFSQEAAFVVRVGHEDYNEKVDEVVELFSSEKVRLNDGTMRNVYNTNLEAGLRPYLQHGAAGYGEGAVLSDGTRVVDALESADVLKIWCSNPALQEFINTRLNSDDPAIRRALGVLNCGVIRQMHYVAAADLQEAMCELVVPTVGGALIEGAIEGLQKAVAGKSEAYKEIVETNKFYADFGYYLSNILGFGTGLWDDSTGASVKLTQTLAARGKKINNTTLGVPEGAGFLQRMNHLRKIVQHGGLPASEEAELIARGADPVVAQGFANVWRRVLIMGSVNVAVTSYMVTLLNNPAMTWGPLAGATAALTLVNAAVIPFDLVRTSIDKIRVRKDLIARDIIAAGGDAKQFYSLMESWDTALTDITQSIEGKSAVMAFTLVAATLPFAWALLNVAPHSEALREVLQALIFGLTPGWENAMTIIMSFKVRPDFKKRLAEFFAVGFTEGVERAKAEYEATGNVSEDTMNALTKEYEHRYDAPMRGTVSALMAKVLTVWTLPLPAVRKSAPQMPVDQARDTEAARSQGSLAIEPAPQGESDVAGTENASSIPLQTIADALMPAGENIASIGTMLSAQPHNA